MNRSRALPMLLALAGLVWALVNGPVEGPVLIVFTPSMGLTTADLLSIALFAAAAVVWRRASVRRRQVRRVPVADRTAETVRASSRS